MTKQVMYNLDLNDKEIYIHKDEQVLLSVSLENKSIDLKQLYNKMEVNIDDVYYFKKGLKKFEKPQGDGERIFNNVYDFLNSLLSNLNTKLKEIRERSDDDSFE